MLILMFNKARGPWSIVREYINRHRQLKRDAETNLCPATSKTSPKSSPNPDSQSIQSPEPNATPTAKRDMPCCSDTDQIVNQLAVLAARVGSSANSAANSSASTNSPCSSSSSHSSSSSTNTAITEPDDSTEKGDLEAEESFHYLRSLITVSGLQHHSSGNRPTSSGTSDSDRQPLRRKRASSRLSLRLGDLPFATKVSRKPCPRYTTLPPVYTPKAVPMRPEVRF